ncbi:MAG TPA: hypothetical protein VED40_02875 [Azospirillaceae bacterium]|nr:hypothetical protein [Azospirillaceae bacterium]
MAYTQVIPGRRRRVAALLPALAGGLVLLLGLSSGLSHFVLPWFDHVPRLRLAEAVTAFLVFAGATAFLGWRAQGLSVPAPQRLAPWLLVGGLALSVVLALGPMQSFPNSADEYGYTFLADTLLRGRLWNEPPPITEAFVHQYSFVKDGKWLSQYAPGWPAMLAGATLLGIPRVLVNPLLGIAAALLCWQVVRRVSVSPTASSLALLAGLATPFWLFNAASFFNHGLALFCVAAVLALSLRDEASPSRWAKAGIGAAFAVLMATRYEVFALVALLFGLDLLWRRRLRVLLDAPWYALGAAPFLLGFLAYNWGITGNPLLTVQAWRGRGVEMGLNAVGFEGQHSVGRAVQHMVVRLSYAVHFWGPLAMVLTAVCLAAKTLALRLRWYDLLLPAAIGFFVLFPDGGGFQYGPRYWHFAIPGVMATIATGLPNLEAVKGRWAAVPWKGLLAAGALLHLCYGAGVTAGYAKFMDDQTSARRQPFTLAEQAGLSGAVILFWHPNLSYTLHPWQLKWRREGVQDFLRNGPDLSTPNLYVNATPATLPEICRLYGDRKVLSYDIDPADAAGRLKEFSCDRLLGPS